MALKRVALARPRAAHAPARIALAFLLTAATIAAVNVRAGTATAQSIASIDSFGNVADAAAAATVSTPPSLPQVPRQQQRPVAALVVSTSRFWFNYRHASNALAVAAALRAAGVPPAATLILLADEAATDARNGAWGTQRAAWADGAAGMYDTCVACCGGACCGGTCCH